MSSGDNHQRPAKRPKVLSEDWEVALRAGQAEEGLAGSVEPELAIVHLLRHARAPEGLEEARLDAVWSDVTGAVDASAAVSWWRRPWMWVGGTAFAAAAAAAVLVLLLPPSSQLGLPSGAAGDDAGTVAVASQGAALERQFQILAPGARQRVAARVEGGRGKLRAALLARALGPDGGGDGSPGGAP
jgi:hypothetical protein